jgi:hypothetical protein
MVIMALHRPQHLTLRRIILPTFTNLLTSTYTRKAPISTTRFCLSPKTTSHGMPDASPNPRWLSDVKKRLGYCISFGLTPQQVQEAGSILKEITNDWRELLAGSEGFLTGTERRGLFKHEIAWGEMVSAVFNVAVILVPLWDAPQPVRYHRQSRASGCSPSNSDFSTGA